MIKNYVSFTLLAAVVSQTIIPSAFSQPQDTSTQISSAPASSTQASQTIQDITKTAMKAFLEGKYELTTEIAEKHPSAYTLSLASRSLNTIAYLEENDKPARAASKRAYKYAQQALEFDENYVEAHVQSAISDAIRAGRISPVRAFMKGLAKRSRKSIDRALALDPDNAWALSTSGAWHLEVKRAGGGRLYGANLEIGFEQLKQARSIMPDNIAIAYEVSLRILAAEIPEWRKEGLAALAVALTSPIIIGVHEEEVRRRAYLFDTAIKQGPKAETTYIKAQE